MKCRRCGEVIGDNPLTEGGWSIFKVEPAQIVKVYCVECAKLIMEAK